MKRPIFFFLTLYFTLLVGNSSFARSGAPPNGYAGNPPAQNTCTACHSSFQLNSGQGSIELIDMPESYQPGETYPISISFEDPDASRWGFELTVIDEDNNRAGTIEVVDGNVIQISGDNPQYLKQRSAGTYRGQRNEATWDFEWTAPDNGMENVTFYIAGNAANNNGGTSGDRIYARSFPLEIAGPEERNLNVPIAAGWNFISINVLPSQDMYEEGEERGPDVLLMLDQLRVNDENHHVLLFKDEIGRFYLPAFGFNNIPFWNMNEGYQIKMAEDVEASWTGQPIPFDTELPIGEGWNFVAYFPDYELDASAPDFYVLSPVIDQVEVAKDGLGRFMLPAFQFSNMQPWSEGNGYQIKVSEDVVLQYPDVENRGAFFHNPFNDHEKTAFRNTSDKNMSVLVNSITGISVQAGDHILAISSEGLVVGTGAVDLDGRCGIAIWGDDISTQILEGLSEGQTFKLMYHEPNAEIQIELEVWDYHSGEKLLYKTDEYMVLETTASQSIPTDLSLNSVYPNPFNNSTLISYSVPSQSFVSLGIFDLNGREVGMLFNGEQNSGEHALSWDASDVSPGIYFLRLNTPDYTQSQKIVLMK